MKKTILYLLLFCCAITSFAQQPVTIQLTEKDGLPDIEFYNVLEDKNGFIWLAADKGLFRYDGKSYLNLNHPQKRGLSVFGLYEDSQGRIWCNTISGQFFYIQNGKMILFTDLKDELKGQLPEFKVIDNQLIAFSEKGIFVIDVQTKKRNIIKDVNSKSPYYGYPFQYKNSLYFTFDNQINVLENKAIKHVFNFNSNINLPANNAFCALKNGLFFASFYNGKQHFFIKNDANFFKSYEVPKELEDKVIINVIERDSLLWFCTNRGVVVCTLIDNKINFKSSYLNGEYTTKIIKDKNNNYWITTLRNGVFVMPNIYIQKIDFNGSSNQVSSLCSVENEYLVYGTSDGKIGYWEKSTNNWKIFSLPSSAKVSQILYNAAFKSIFISQDNQAYIWNLSRNEIYSVPFFISSKGISIAANNDLLNASYDRASLIKNPFANEQFDIKIHLNNPKWITKSNNPPKEDIRFKRAYTTLYSKKTNKKYVGFVDELMAFDNQNNAIPIRYNNKPLLAIDLQETEDGTIWVATFNDGLFAIKNDKVIKTLNSQNGLLSNQINKLKINATELWIATDKGVQLYDVTKKSFKNLTKNDGLESYTISDMEVVDGSLYLSSNKGIYIIDRIKGFKNFRQPIVYFTSVAIEEKDTVLQNKYELAYDKNAIKFSFNSTGFQNTESIQYQYKMQGLNSNWIPLEKGIDFVRYASLPAGNYTFTVRAVNANGLFSENKTILIEVNAPFWQKWWFYIVLIVGVGAASWMYFKIRFARLEKEKQIAIEKAEMDKELVFSQLENLRSQMNPHFIFNALNSIQEYIVSNEKETASAFLVKFSRLIRIYLEHSRMSEVQLDDELKALHLYLELEKDRFEDTLNYSIHVSSEIDVKAIKIPSLFLQPYIENALKHGLLHKKENRILEINFKIDPKKSVLFCQISDNGIGRDAAALLNQNRQFQHKSFATTANQKRVELINKTRKNKTEVTINDLVNEQNKACGTEVVIRIPLI
ncbi:histidine kinase [Flavobacterium sp.]|uniref:histidine kinase n=3 Tax=Flavobacterium sp. TaxID=239 RepID=UPI0040475D12